MDQFFSHQMDYIFFFYGFAFILLMPIVLKIRRQGGPVADPWKWLAAFGVLHGVNEWLDMAVFAAGDSLTFKTIRLLFLSFSFFCLLEFGRAGTQAAGGKAPGGWLTLSIFGISLIGVVGGLTSANVVFRYVLALPGGLWSAWALWRYSQKIYPGNKGLKRAAAAMALYAVLTGFIVPRASFLPASIIHHDSFIAWAGFPIQLLRGALAIVIAMACLRFYETVLLKVNGNSWRERKWERTLLLLMFCALIAGWLATDWIGHNREQMLRNNIKAWVETAAAGINEQRVMSLTGSQNDVRNPDYIRLKDQLSRVRRANTEVRFCYLIRMTSSGTVAILADSEEIGSRDYSSPGQVFSEGGRELMEVFKTAAPGVVGPVRDRWGECISAYAPVRSREGQITAVLGMDIPVKEWERIIYAKRLFPILTTLMLLTLLIVFYVEVQRHKDAVNAISESEEKFRAIFDHSAAAIMLADEEERLVSWNRFTENLLGLCHDELYMRPMESFYPPEEWQKIRSLDIRTKGMIDHFETKMSRKDGSLLEIDVSISVMRDPLGKAHGSIGIARDISLRKEDEAKIKKKVEELVVQLLQAEKMTTLGEMSAGITHELNQPLNVTKLICQGIMRDIEKGRFSLEDAQKDLPEVVKQMNKMAEIIDHMRIFSRQTSGMERIKHDLNDIIRDSLKFISQQFSQHHIELVTRLDAELPAIRADQIQIEQVILNLLGNARFATQNSGRTGMSVEVVTFADKNGREVVMEVRDNGPGIPETAKAKIFQAFFTTKEAGKGTGLGLSVSKKIIEEHGGRIEFESREGVGTVFRVTLPAFV